MVLLELKSAEFPKMTIFYEKIAIIIARYEGKIFVIFLKIKVTIYPRD